MVTFCLFYEQFRRVLFIDSHQPESKILTLQVKPLRQLEENCGFAVDLQMNWSISIYQNSNLASGLREIKTKLNIQNSHLKLDVTFLSFVFVLIA